MPPAHGFGNAVKKYREDLGMSFDSAEEANVARFFKTLITAQIVIAFQRPTPEIKIVFGRNGTANDATIPDFWLTVPRTPLTTCEWMQGIWTTNLADSFGHTITLPVEVKGRLRRGGMLRDIPETELQYLQEDRSDPASAIKLRRAKKIFKDRPFLVIGAYEYDDISQRISTTCAEWEGTKRAHKRTPKP